MTMNHQMSVAEAAKQSGVSPGLLYQWVNNKRILSSKNADKILRVSLDEVKAYHKTRKARKTGKPGEMRKTWPEPPPEPAAAPEPTASQFAAATRAAMEDNHTTNMVKALNVIFPDGIRPEDYATSLMLIRVLEMVAAK